MYCFLQFCPFLLLDFRRFRATNHATSDKDLQLPVPVLEGDPPLAHAIGFPPIWSVTSCPEKRLSVNSLSSQAGLGTVTSKAMQMGGTPPALLW